MQTRIIFSRLDIKQIVTGRKLTIDNEREQNLFDIDKIIETEEYLSQLLGMTVNIRKIL